MELSSRMSSILYVALDSNGWVDIDALMRETGLSRSAINYDLSKIDVFLARNGFSPIEADENGVGLAKGELEGVGQLLSSLPVHLSSQTERLLIESLDIALSGERTTIEGLCRELDVSKNTVLTDLRALKERVLQFGVALEYQHGSGYWFSGDELKVRSFLFEEIGNVENRSVWRTVIEKVNRTLCSEQGHLDSQFDAYQAVLGAIETYDKVIHASFVEQFMRQAAVMVLVSYLRSNVKGCTAMLDDVNGRTLSYTQEFEQVKTVLIAALEAQGLTFSKNETYYIAYLLLGLKRLDFEGRSRQAIMGAVDEFLIGLERRLGFALDDKGELRERIALHMEPMFYRTTLGFHSVNIICDDIREMYPALFSMVRESLLDLDFLDEASVDDGEVAFLVMFIESHLSSRGARVEGVARCNKVLVVCGAGMSASVFIRTQLEEVTGAAFRYELCSVSKLEERDFSEYCMVVSAVRDARLPEGTIFVPPLLAERDIEAIVLELCNQPIRDSASVNEILSVISDRLKSRDDLEMARRDLFNYFLYRGEVNEDVSD